MDFPPVGTDAALAEAVVIRRHRFHARHRFGAGEVFVRQADIDGIVEALGL